MVLVSSVGTMAAGVAEAVSSNIELVSDNGSVGGTDPKTLVSLDGGSTFQPASIINPHPFYGIIPGTGWVSDPTAGSSRQGIDTIFQTTFDLPAGVQTASITVQVHADNAATVLLNGTRIGAQREAEIFENFQDPAETYTATGPFVAGRNVLRFVVHNFSGPMGLDYRAGVSYSIPASTDLGVVLNGVPDTRAVGSEPFPASATVTNGGPDALGAGEASVTVGFPSGLSLAGGVPGGCSAVNGEVSCPVPALAVGASWTSPAVELSAGRPTGSRTVTARVATVPVTQDQDDTDNVDSDDVAVVITTDLSTTLSGVPATIRIGSGFPVSSSVGNGGQSDLAAGEAAWSMSVSSGLIISGAAPTGCTQDSRTLTCPVAPLAAGGVATMPEVTLVAVGGGAQTVTVTARTADPSQDAQSANNVAVATVRVPLTDLGVVLGGVPVTWAVGSEPFPASATVTNGGPDALGAGEASVTVGFPSGLSLAGAVPGGCSAVNGGVSCPVPALAVGATWTSPAVELSAGRPTGSRTVTARVATVPVTQDQDDTDNVDSDDVAVVITTDLSTTLSGVPSTSKATVPFTVSSSVRNSGPSDLAAGEAASTITIGPGLEFSGLTPGGCMATATTVTCPVPALVSSGSWTVPSVTVVGTSAGTSSTVTAATTTAAGGQDPVPANDSDADAVTIAPPPAPVATLSTTTLDFGSHRVGSSSAPQSVAVTNTGDAPLHMDGVTVTGDFAVDSGCPTGTTLAPGQSCTVRATFTPTTTGARPGTLILTHDAVSSPDVVSLSGVGQLHADVSLSMDAGPGPVRTGRMTYRITVRNSGPDEATGLVMSDTLPVDAELVSIDPGSWSCTTPPVGQSGTVRCGLASLASGATATLEVVVQVVAQRTSPVSNTASVSTSSHDPAPADNAATVVRSVGRG